MYRGRFAPSPTGPLHFGSLVAAVGSYLEARTQGGEWLVRIEDVDAPRCQLAHESSILRTLICHGFRIDGEIMRQRDRTGAYQSALNTLHHANLVFGCACTRKEIEDTYQSAARLQGEHGHRHDGGVIYPGTCRHGLAAGKEARAWRLRVTDADISFDDSVQGRMTQNLLTEVGDFVLLRADGLFAYQLAVVLDDAEQEITHVVRGADLLDSTPRQIYLQQCLGLSTPHYLHLPIAVNAAGEKLSKQTLAAPLNDDQPVPAIWDALTFLGQQPPDALRSDTLQTIWDWALTHWQRELIPKQFSHVMR